MGRWRPPKAYVQSVADSLSTSKGTRSVPEIQQALTQVNNGQVREADEADPSTGGIYLQRCLAC